jgi:MoxR-like ATPase
VGKVELAAGSSLFLDEVGELPPEVQVKLLRLAEEKTFERVGGTETLVADVRVIAATHRDLAAMVREGREDVVALADHFLRLVEAYLWHHSVGNPRAIVEMIDQLRREPAITEDAARNLDYPGARPQLDLTPIILILAVFLVAARFVARGLGDTEAYILAGVGAALVMGLQFLLFRLRR